MWQRRAPFRDGAVAEGHVEYSIYPIRGLKVMLDRDLAGLYGVEARVLSQAVKRNRDRVPTDFMFELSREEVMRISQSVTSSAGLKYAKTVHVFTEHRSPITTDYRPLEKSRAGLRNGGIRVYDTAVLDQGAEC